ncbi:MAG: hypothetical protein HYS06_00960 [Methylocystis sp.]|nr:hypothetical protein [Methylocystis sp.]
MKLSALVITAAVISSPAYAEDIVVGCPLIKQYSEDQVSSLLNQVRSVVGEQEIGKIYYKYVSLKTACQVNDNAVRTLPVSPSLRTWLGQNGVDIKKIGRQL